MRLALFVAVTALAGCKPPESSAPPASPHAEVAKDSELLVVRLSTDAERRLGITIGAVERVAMERPRTCAGEVLLPPGRAIVLAVPLAGTLCGAPLAVGRLLDPGQTVMTVTPLLTAESRASLAAMRIEAEGALAGATVQLEAGDVALARCERLLREGVGSQRAIDEARATRDVARAVAKAARDRRELLAGTITGTAGSLPITAPFAGMLRQVFAAPGQVVGAGSALCEIADHSELWIRVPVYFGDLADIDASKEVSIDGRVARPVSAPPAGSAAAATVDLVYSVPNQDGSLRPGQRALVALPPRRSEPRLAVPWSAVHHDVYGGTWIYESLGDRKFVRRRVQVPFVVEGIAAIEGAIAPGTPVVTVGVPELNGIEFGHAR